MIWANIILAILLGYSLGSIPFGYLFGRLKGVDVRQYGSGRTGGTNVYRAAGTWVALLTGLFDVLKGVAAVLLARQFLGSEVAAALAGAFAVCGHNWSIFLGFRGGAGGGTGAGALLALNPLAGLVIVPIFLVVLFVGRYASIATLAVGIGALVVLPISYLLGAPSWLGFPTPPGHILFGLLVALWILISLRPEYRPAAGRHRTPDRIQTLLSKQRAGV